MPKISLQMTEADFFASQRAFYRRKLWVKVMLAAGAVALALGLFEAVWQYATAGAYHVLDALPLLLVALLWLWFPGRLLWGAPASARRYFRQSQISRPLDYEWDDQALSVRGENIFQRVAWADVPAWSESREAIAILVTDRTYLPIPKRFLSAGDLEDLRGRLSARGGA